ncbi:hypothetical protein C3941_07120 [Kaistia algarum]|uniref:virulence factor family protein n=1 Tax=Kaistia algarum TaxID=2083279 RepID=UPI000CE77CFE|nr:AcvB/VirJ family lysyl-phosphatidylglycerol hydrolase [Kaistia algarum]MCX5515553.1 cutinase family protein [Kaistia algarum]PPE81048.1 hypothetical protein C3941_07120 [Kaistia algarum]
MALARNLSAIVLAIGCGILLRADARHALPDLPIIVMPVQSPRNTMAVVYSGDGGWRDLDRSIAGIFQKRGVPTVGIDSLHYFWSKKTRKRTSADLARIIDHYSGRWGATRVVLVGYSFGADVLPAAYDQLPAKEKAKVAEISLLGLSDRADYEISARGFLGLSGDVATLPDISKIPPLLVQCFYGSGEGDSACSRLKGSGVDVIETAGGHHFDGNYEALAMRILDGLDRRVATAHFPVAAR